MDELKRINALFADYTLKLDGFNICQMDGVSLFELKNAKQLSEMADLCEQLRGVLVKRWKSNPIEDETWHVFWNNGLIVDEGKAAFSFESHKGDVLSMLKSAIEILQKEIQ